MLTRIIEKNLLQSIQPGKVIGLFGARRTGKTVLMKRIYKKLNSKKILLVQGENLDVAEILSSRRLGMLERFLTGYQMLFIDEAQQIPDIGVNLKLIVDNLPHIAVFITGSSAFDLNRKTGEPLTRRGRNFMLFPFAQSELGEDYLQQKKYLADRLIYGYYPQVVTATTQTDKIEVLQNIRNGYLLRDILELDNLKDSLFILNLLRLLALQTGNDVSVSELASNLQVNNKTILRYLELLEKCYVIYSHQGFSRNLRKEFTKSLRYYFWDNGIRNAVINNFNDLSSRDDTGPLWENFCITERKKMNHYAGRHTNYYFWRTYDQQEIDLIEECDGHLNGYEFKWKSKKAKKPTAFAKNYPDAGFELISQENYYDFIDA